MRFGSRCLGVVAVVGSFAVVGPSAAGAQAAPPAEAQAVRDEVQRLRQELEDLRREYEERLAGLESRLASLEGASPGAAEPPLVAQTPPPPQAPPVETEVPAGAAGAGGPSGSLPVYGGTAALSKIFNPDIAVIGNFVGAVGENAVDPPAVLEMEEAELSLQAIVDPYARADFFLAFGPEGVGIEEAYLTLPTLPGGLLMKAGKLRAQFGRLNAEHTHMVKWVDRPLVTGNLVGGEEGIADSGLSVSRLILNPWFFLEATGEAFQGNSEVFTAHRRSDLTYVARLRGYRDITDSTNVDLGVSAAFGKNGLGSSSDTRLLGVDATFRYRPLRRAIYRRLFLRSELVWSRADREDGPVSAFGTYVTGEYQFARRWFLGARGDYSERAYDSSLKDKGGSVFVTFWPSEFSQVRGQYRHTRYAEGVKADEVLFQFLFSIGAHGAHAF